MGEKGDKGEKEGEIEKQIEKEQEKEGIDCDKFRPCAPSSIAASEFK